MTSTTSLSKSRHGRVLKLTLESDCGRHPVSPELGLALHSSIADAESDDAVGAILLTGSGKTFSAGGDIGGLIAGLDAGRPDAETRALLAQSASGCLALMRSAKPTIALVNGAAAGGGLALAAACDIRLASHAAKFAFAYPRIALAGDLAACWSLNRILGPSRALYFALSAKRLSASEALALGLIAEVHADDGLQQAGLTLAQDIASMSPIALAQVKMNFRAAATVSRDEAIEIESDNFLLARAHPDHREAAVAFIEKRRPRWTQGAR